MLNFPRNCDDKRSDFSFWVCQLRRMDNMRRRASWHLALVCIATFGLLASKAAQAADEHAPSQPVSPPAPTEPTIVDVGLQASGALTGQVLGPDGRGAVGETVFVLRGPTVVATCQTNSSGGFAITGLGGGLYDVRCRQGGTLCRLWAPQTAPPSAKPTLMLTTGGPVVRGQTTFFRRDSGWLKGPAPWIIAGAAITGAIIWDVVASQRHSFDRDHPPSS
jgi:hypothetical protein